MNNGKEFLKPVQENPEPPIVPMVDGEVCWDRDMYGHRKANEVCEFGQKVGSHSQLTVEQLIYNLTYLVQNSPEEDQEKLIADFCHKHIKNN